MKRIWVAISLIIIALVTGITEFCVVKNSYDKYTKLLDTAEDYISRKEYKKALDVCTYTLKEWEDNEKTLNLFLLHSRVDEVTEDIEQLCEYAQNKERTMFSSTCVKAKRQLQHLKMSELPLIENIM